MYIGGLNLHCVWELFLILRCQWYGKEGIGNVQDSMPSAAGMCNRFSYSHNVRTAGALGSTTEVSWQ